MGFAHFCSPTPSKRQKRRTITFRISKSISRIVLVPHFTLLLHILIFIHHIIQRLYQFLLALLSTLQTLLQHIDLFIHHLKFLLLSFRTTLAPYTRNLISIQQKSKLLISSKQLPLERSNKLYNHMINAIQLQINFCHILLWRQGRRVRKLRRNHFPSGELMT